MRSEEVANRGDDDGDRPGATDTERPSASDRGAAKSWPPRSRCDSRPPPTRFAAQLRPPSTKLRPGARSVARRPLAEGNVPSARRKASGASMSSESVALSCFPTLDFHGERRSNAVGQHKIGQIEYDRQRIGRIRPLRISNPVACDPFLSARSKLNAASNLSDGRSYVAAERGPGSEPDDDHQS